MKTKIAVLLATMLTMGSCEQPEAVFEPSPTDRAVIEFKSSEVYRDLKTSGVLFEWAFSQLVEFPQFDLLFVRVPLAGSRDTWYSVKRDKTGNWSHHMRSSFDGDQDRVTGTLTLDSYPWGAYSIHTFDGGQQKEYQLFTGQDPAQNTLGRLHGRTEIDGCESICTALDCAGRKYEDQNWFQMVKCAYYLPICLTMLVAECYYEDCPESQVETCNTH